MRAEPPETEPMRDRSSEKLVIVEALRGIAALSVAWFHLTNSYDFNAVRWSGAFGWAGVDVFFVISGFILPLSIASGTVDYRISDFPRFLLRRLIRLEPPYIGSIILVIVLWHLSALAADFRGADPHIEPLRVAAHTLYLIPLTEFGWLQPVYWTLAWEFLFYIFIGLTFGLFEARKSDGIWLAAVALAAALVLADIVNARVLLFVIGLSVYRATATPRPRAVINLSIAAAAAAVLASEDVASAVAGGGAAILIFAFKDVRWGGRTTEALLWLGSLSYSLYLVHVPVGGRVVNFGHRFAQGPVLELILSLAALAASLIAAVVFYRLLEAPAIGWAKSIARRRRLPASRDRRLRRLPMDQEAAAGTSR